MGLKPIKIFALFIIITFTLVTPVLASTPLAIEIVQSDVKLPQIKLYVDVYDENDNKLNEPLSDNVKLEALLDGKPLKINSFTPFNKSKEYTDFTFLIDVSKSISNSDFNSIKSMLNTWIDSMKDQDTISIITFGEEVKVLQKHLLNKATAKENINGIKLTDNKTRFYDGIAKAMNVAKIIDDEIPDRRVIFTVTDGEDYYTGGKTKNEVIESIKEESIPIYSLGVYSGSLTKNKRDNLNKLGEISRASGGSYTQMGDTSFENILAKTLVSINNCYIAELNADKAVADGKSYNLYFSLEQNGKKLDDKTNILLNNTLKDKISPEIISVEVTEHQEIYVYFSEDVSGANIAENYQFQIKDKSEENTTAMTGETYKPTSVEYLQNEKGYYANIIFEPPTEGNYKLTVSNISDVSPQKNVMQAVSYDLRLKEVIAKSFIEKNLIYILPILIVLAIVFYLIRKAKPKQNQSSNATNNNISISNIPKRTVQIHFAVIDSNNNEKTYNLEISDSLIIGRSRDCDLRFNDNEMSRKHCEISLVGDNLLIKDLNSTNTTILNGVPLVSYRKLESNDIILVGQTELRVSFEL